MRANTDITPGEFIFAEGMPEIDYRNIKRASMILRAVNHKFRQQLLKTIYDNKKATVTQLYVKLRLEQSVTSQHLSILRHAGAVIAERQGKFVYYSINSSRLKEINRFATNILK